MSLILLEEIIKMFNELPDDILEEKIFNLIDTKLINRDETNTRVWMDQYKKMPHFLQYIYATMVFEDEINNGGYPQFFFNNSGHLIFNVLNGYKEIHAYNAKEEVERLINELNKVKSLEKGVSYAIENNKTIEDYFAEDWDKINFPIENEFFNSEPEIKERRLNYIKENLAR